MGVWHTNTFSVFGPAYRKAQEENNSHCRGALPGRRIFWKSVLKALLTGYRQMAPVT